MQPLSEDLQENLDRFIVESLELGCVWGLCDSEGNWAMVPSGVKMPRWALFRFGLKSH